MINSVYIHIPFCTNICSYCHFTKFTYDCVWVDNYLTSLEHEIKENYRGDLIKTLYIGGGTPSSLNLKQLEKLMMITNIFKVSNDLEFTIEVNPESVTKEKLLLLKEYNVNRISMGVETTHSKFLTYLKRNHDFNLVKEKISLIKELGFSNINVDLMYAIKNENLDDLKIDIKNLLDLKVNHISTYSLMIEDHTFLRHEEPIAEELDREMYDFICQELTKNGYNHYEISNFSRSGYESRHNLVYWNNDKYYGFGISASGYIDNYRYTNTSSYSSYLKGNYTKEREDLSKKDILFYALILGFRKIKGINKQEFKKKYQIDILDIPVIKKLIEENKLINDLENIYVSYDKIYIENSILIEFVGV